MERNDKRIFKLLLLAVLTAAGWYLRYAGPVHLAAPLAWGSAAMVLVFVLCSIGLRPAKTYADGNGTGMARLILSCLAAAGMLVSALLRFREGDGLLQSALPAATALCWAVTAFLRKEGKPAAVWFFLIPTIFFGVELIDKFRGWGSDPLILDYCYQLLALIATMCAVFHLGGYCFDRGQRRITVFFAMAGIYFNGVALADVSGGEAVIKLAAVLWLAVNLWTLLGEKKEA